jgi:hypothetical protein
VIFLWDLINLDELFNHHVTDIAHKVFDLGAYVRHVQSTGSLVDQYEVEGIN